MRRERKTRKAIVCSTKTTGPLGSSRSPVFLLFRFTLLRSTFSIRFFFRSFLLESYFSRFPRDFGLRPQRLSSLKGEKEPFEYKYISFLIIHFFYVPFVFRFYVLFYSSIFLSILQILMPDKDKAKLVSTEKRKADDIEQIKDLKKVNIELRILCYFTFVSPPSFSVLFIFIFVFLFPVLLLHSLTFFRPRFFATFVPLFHSLVFAPSVDFCFLFIFRVLTV